MKKTSCRRNVVICCAMFISTAGVMAALDVEIPQAGPDNLIAENKTKEIKVAKVNRNEFESVILLTNKDTLHGDLIAIDEKDGSVKWKHANAKKTIDFDMKYVSNIELDEGDGHITGNSLVELTNDDSIVGKIVSMDEKTLTLSTSFAGDMKIKRLMIKSIGMNNMSGELMYEGPANLSNWTFKDYNNRPSWELKDGVLSPNYTYTIGRNIKNMPDMVNFEFEAKWRSYPSFAFIFCSDRVNSYSGNNYSMRFSSSSIYLDRYTSSRGSSRVGSSMNYSRFSSSSSSAKSAKFNVLVDKKRNRIVLMVDGAYVNEWVDSSSFAGMGNGIIFYPKSSSRLPSFRNIKVSRWDGKIPRPENNKTKEADADIIVFENNDKVSGSIMSVNDSVVTLKTEYAPLPIPVERIRHITMSTKEQERARRNAKDIKMIFTQHGALTLNLEYIKDGEVKGSSENFGELTMPVNVLSELQFNIYKESKKSSSRW